MDGSVRRRYGLVARLHDRPDTAAAYERYHAAIWPEVIADGRKSGVIRTSIFRDERRLFMVMDTDDAFDIATFGIQPADQRTQEWASIMDTLLEDQPGLRPGQKWRLVGTVCDVE